MYIRKYHRSDAIIAIYVVYLALSQILAVKLILLGDFVAPAAVVIYPFTFQLTDTVNEHFGQAETHRMIFIAFITQILMVIFIYFGNTMDPAPFWNIDNDQWLAIFSQQFGIIAASWISFVITENLDAIIFTRIKGWTKGNLLWVRSVLSDVPMLALDSIIFVGLAFGVFNPIGDWGLVLSLIWGQMIMKWLFGVIDTPYIYLDRAIAEKKTPAEAPTPSEVSA